MKLLALAIFSIFCISCGQTKDFVASNNGGGGAAGSCGDMTAEACQMYGATNAERTAQGLAPLQVLSRCVEMAQDHAEDMVIRGFFSHNSPTETFSARVSRYGLGGAYAGENISRGSSSVSVTLAGWMGSTGHRANILNSSFRAMGVGFYQNYWVQCFSGFPGDVQ